MAWKVQTSRGKKRTLCGLGLEKQTKRTRGWCELVPRQRCGRRKATRWARQKGSPRLARVIASYARDQTEQRWCLMVRAITSYARDQTKQRWCLMASDRANKNVTLGFIYRLGLETKAAETTRDESGLGGNTTQIQNLKPTRP